jgi:hypothetical protein
VRARTVCDHLDALVRDERRSAGRHLLEGKAERTGEMAVDVRSVRQGVEEIEALPALEQLAVELLGRILECHGEKTPGWKIGTPSGSATHGRRGAPAGLPICSGDSRGQIGVNAYHQLIAKVP